MAAALYGPGGFFVRPDGRPAAHFRTSALASPLFAGALLRLLQEVDAALGRPDPLDVVDIGAGGGELLAAMAAAAPPPLAARLRLTAVEVAAPPAPDTADLDEFPSSGRRKLIKISWRTVPPDRSVGLLLATEWLDNVPVDVAEVDGSGVPRYVLVDPITGAESLGDRVTGADAAWLARWWPLGTPGDRAEIGLPRDTAWAGAVGTLNRGLALAVDYGHMSGGRPPWGTLTGFRDGREVPPVPDGSCDLTAHVALDAAATAGALALRTHTHRGEPLLITQRAALQALGVTGTRPPVALAHTDPAAYLRALAAAGAAAELTDPAGLGGHHWLLQPVGMAVPGPIPGLGRAAAAHGTMAA
jgi:SAM-dependent MidA family methyltransferase